MKMTSGIVLMLVMGLMVCPAGAETVFFQDDFEGAAGASPYTWADQMSNPAHRSDSDPNNALIGTWAVNYEYYDWDIQATSSAPGPYAGTKYLRVHRTSSAADLLARFEATAVPVTTECRIRVDAGSAYIGSTLTPATLTGNSSDWLDNARFFLLFYDNREGVTNGVWHSGSGGWTDTGLRYTSGWNSLNFVTDMTTGKASVTLNGTTVNNLSLISTGNTNAVIIRGAGDGHEFSVDDISVKTAQSTGVTLQGTVQPGGLNGYTGDISLVGIQVELRQGGETVRTEKTFLDADGKFLLDNVTPGIYDIAIKGCAWLEKVLPEIPVSAPTDLGTISIFGGDNDGDNQITSTDLSIVLANFQ